MFAEGGVDLLAAQTIRKRTRRHHRLRSGDLRVVAFVGYPDQIVSQTKGIDDFGCTRKQRQNSHGSLASLRTVRSIFERNAFARSSPFPTFPPDPELDSGAKRQRQSREAEGCRIAFVEKVFDAGKERLGGIQSVSSAQINFLVTGI